jgi:hypothetical protein
MRDGIYASFSPGQNAPCLCGSGLKFKRCCGPKLNEDLAVQASTDAFNAGRHKEALMLCRRYFSRYLVWHRAHTVPLVERGIKPGDEIMRIDIEALGDMLDLMRECYLRIEQTAEFRTVLMRLTPAVDDPRWSEKILYQRALLALCSRSAKDARQVLNEIPTSEHIHDFDLLTLYFDVLREELPVSRQIQLVHQLAAGARKREERLQYGLLKGHYYRLIGDEAEGLRMIREMVDGFESSRVIDYSVRERHLLAVSLLFLARSDTRLEDAQRARNLILEELASDRVTNAGRALFQVVLGDTYAAEGNFRVLQNAFVRVSHLKSSRRRTSRCRAL